ncbi:MAG: flippase-like domain-containing protein [Acidobacteriota bacterium]|nr:flippase-like domain-containing protein [Acidobacteriota bacterium]
MSARRTSPVVRRGATVVVAGLALYVALPAFVRVWATWPRLSTLNPWWLVLVVVSEAASFTCAIALLRLVTRDAGWFASASALLAGNAVTNTVPGGDAIGAGVTFRVLAAAGVRRDQVAGGLAASSVLNFAGLLALPVFALPALLGGVVNADLAHAAELGLVGCALMLGLGAVVLTRDAPLRALGRGVSWALHALRPRRARLDDLASRLLAQRDLVREDLGRNWWKAVLAIAGRVGFDFASLLAALRATGARPHPSLVLIAYAATAIVALVPLTPGGLGIVEASLGGLLVLAGVPSSRAILATLAYRLGSYWLPLVAGAVAYSLFRRRYGAPRASGETVTPS